MVKMAPVMRELQEAGLDYWFLHTGQHRETFDDLRRDFGVKPPDADAVCRSNDAKTLSRFGHWSLQATAALAFRRQRLLPVRHGFVLVHGDTASTVWGALLGRATGNTVVHIESGLRSFRLLSPFPEELFRLATFRLADVYACPDKSAVKNLELYRGERIDLGGNTLYDALQLALDAQTEPDTPIPARRFGVISIHRFETLFRRQRLGAVVQGVVEAARRCPLLMVAHPPLVHRLEQDGLMAELNATPGVYVIPRMSYFPFVTLLQRSAFVITDGGSNQEELAYLGKPTLILRAATERGEGLGANAIMRPVSAESIVSFVDESEHMTTEPLRYSHSPSRVLVARLRERIQERSEV